MGWLSSSRMIVSIGDLVLDISIVPEGLLQADDDSPATITVGGGGQAANFCAWAAALGEPVRLVTRVGDDERGRNVSLGGHRRVARAPRPRPWPRRRQAECTEDRRMMRIA